MEQNPNIVNRMARHKKTGYVARVKYFMSEDVVKVEVLQIPFSERLHKYCPFSMRENLSELSILNNQFNP